MQLNCPNERERTISGREPRATSEGSLVAANTICDNATQCPGGVRLHSRSDRAHTRRRKEREVKILTRTDVARDGS